MEFDKFQGSAHAGEITFGTSLVSTLGINIHLTHQNTCIEAKKSREKLKIFNFSGSALRSLQNANSCSFHWLSLKVTSLVAASCICRNLVKPSQNSPNKLHNLALIFSPLMFSTCAFRNYLMLEWTTRLDGIVKPRIHERAEWFTNQMRICVDGTANLRCAIYERSACCLPRTKI